MIDTLAGQAAQVVEDVRAALPDGFPASVSEPILDGLADAARRFMP